MNNDTIRMLLYTNIFQSSFDLEMKRKDFIGTENFKCRMDTLQVENEFMSSLAQIGPIVWTLHWKMLTLISCCG